MTMPEPTDTPTPPPLWWSPSHDMAVQESGTGIGFCTLTGHTGLVALPDDAVRLLADEMGVLDANEAMGDALVEIGMALGLERPRTGATWGAPEILAEVRNLRAQLEASMDELPAETGELARRIVRAASLGMREEAEDAIDSIIEERDAYADQILVLQGQAGDMAEEIEQLRTQRAAVLAHLDCADSVGNLDPAWIRDLLVDEW